jgi:hypothetical protein
MGEGMGVGGEWTRMKIRTRINAARLQAMTMAKLKAEWRAGVA